MQAKDVWHCIVCETPTNERLVCSRECFLLNEFYKSEKHRYGKLDMAHKNGMFPRRAVVNAKRNCDYCKAEFIARNSKMYYCSPQCRTLSPASTPYKYKTRFV